MHEPNSESTQIFRSPLLMNRDDTALVVIDVQTKLVPLIQNHRRIIWNTSRLIRGAKELGVRVCATEQYPKGLGATVDEVLQHLDPTVSDSIPEKLMFSCRECDSVFMELSDSGVHKLLVVGIESHVCVLQSVLDLLASGFSVYVGVDAVGSRCKQDHRTAIRRMESSGAALVTTETALFEWCEVAGTSEFKTISRLVQESEPVA